MLTRVVYSHPGPLDAYDGCGTGRYPSDGALGPVPNGLFSATGFVRYRDYRLLPALTPYDARGTTGYYAPSRGVDPRLEVLEASVQAAEPGICVLKFKKAPLLRTPLANSQDISILELSKGTPIRRLVRV